MAVKVVLILSVVAQFVAALLALRLNTKYRQLSAWFLISAAALLMTIRRLATLFSIWFADPEQLTHPVLWTASLSTLLTSVLFLAGIALIEPLFGQIAQAQQVLQREKLRLEKAVQASEEELRLAGKIQRHLLPTSAPSVPGLDIAGASTPAVWTSGDYFDFIPMSDGHWAVAVADVSGHGTGPALLMAETRALVRALAQTQRDVREILSKANQLLVEDVVESRFIAISLTGLDCENRRLSFAGAGASMNVLSAGGSDLTLDPGGTPLGITEKLCLDEQPDIPWREGDVWLWMTDGILESESPTGEMFGFERAVEVVRNSHDRSARETVDALFEATRKFRGGKPAQDDLTAVVIKVVPEQKS